MPRHGIRSIVTGVLCSALLVFVSTLPAQAGMLTSDRVLNAANPERQALVEALERDDVRAQLERFGVSAQDAERRVARMTDAEVARLHQQVASLPAGGNISTVELLLIIILVILIV